MDLDKATKKAWRRFRIDLADRLSELATHETIGVGVESSVDDSNIGRAPFVEFCRNGDVVIAEVSGNRYLHPSHRLDKAARRNLVARGWSRPAPKQGIFNFGFEADISHADQLAALTVATLREVFGVPHPAFLVGDVQIVEDPDLPYVENNDQTDEPHAIMPEGHEHLNQLVEQALTPAPGQAPTRDHDEDIPYACGTAVVFVRVLQHAPLIKIWAEVAVEITDLDRAKFEVAVLNRDRPFAKFLLVADRIIAQAHLLAAPFVPAHLRATLAMMCELADEVDDDLAVRVKGRRFLEPSELLSDETDDADDADEDQGDSDDIHPAMLTLLQLDAQRPGSVKPALAARVCDDNPELLLKLIRWNEEQELAWRSSAVAASGEDGSGDEAEVCEHEADHARRTAKLLRKALRLVVEAGVPDHGNSALRRRNAG